MASQCEMTELTRFPELREKVVDTVNGMLRKCVGPTQSMISNLINIELAYINTSHPDFIGKDKRLVVVVVVVVVVVMVLKEGSCPLSMYVDGRWESSCGSIDGEDRTGECGPCTTRGASSIITIDRSCQ